MANNAVTNAKIADGTIQASKIDWTTFGWSTDEVDTGITYKGNKHIFKKDISWGKMPNNNTDTRQNQFPNGANIVKIEATASTSSAMHMLPHIGTDGSIDAVWVADSSQGRLSVRSTADRSSWDLDVRLFYTK